MAKSLFSHTLIRISSSSPRRPPPLLTGASSASRFVNLRSRSSGSEKSQLIEVDLDQDGEVEVMGMRRIEDAIHSLMLRRAAPDWLPFVPGSSYWVPPRKRPYGIAELIGRLANPMSEDESLSLTNVRGWPSSAYFIEGKTHPIKIKRNYGNSHVQSESEDEEA
ncbi:hypothetical protein Syun_024799 [Stephania yunnanensis]|uniref:Uncharacterized protein n=1 Tax=Stephania yunnanensis TaxID=152371 RepID=A0AAP0HU48_9MAGN